MSLRPDSSRIKKKRRLAGEGWVSYNRVLVGSTASKKNIGRNPNFDTDETKLLIQLWGDPKVQRTLITTHKKHSVICQLAARMQEYGYYRSPEEITTRIKNLKCFYNRLKKDMESGQASEAEPSWRHFAEMDAIMTRPIFSVRPNEVPQPSLRYQLEQKREEREERRKRLLEGGGTLSDSEDNNDDDIDARSKTNNVQDIDDGIIPDVEVDMDINDETFAAITAVEASALSSVSGLKITTNGDIESENDAPDNDDDDDDDKSLHIKEEDEDEERQREGEEEQEETESNKSTDYVNGKEHHEIESTNETQLNIDTEIKAQSKDLIAGAKTTESKDGAAKDNAALIIPKEEPIDVDTEYDVSMDKNIKPNVGELMPTLAEMLKMTKPSGTTVTNNSAPTTCSSAVTTFASVSLTTSTPTAAATKIAASTSTGKISLVPASFLLPQQSPAAAQQTTGGVTAHQPQQMQLLSNVMSNTPTQIQPRMVSAAPAGIVATGPGGMKVLLVNADQAETSSSLKQQIQLQQTVPSHPQSYRQILQNQKQQQQKHQMQNQKEEKRKQKKKPKLLPQPSQPPPPPLQRQKSPPIPSENVVDVARKEFSSVATRQLMRQLHDVLEENNDIQRKRLRLENERLESERSALEVERKRLSLERERLDFERSAFDRLLNMLPNMLQQQQQIPQIPQIPQPDHFVNAAAPTAMLFNPSKLVFSSAGTATAFATTVPAVSGATAVFAPANNFTSTNLTATSAAAVVPQQMEICTQINEFQLLTPKLEKEE